MTTYFRSVFLLILFAAGPLGAVADQLTPGSTHRLTFRDVDAKEVSTADGRVTILTVVTRDNGDTSRVVADLVPDRYVGDEKYRYVTLVNFQRKLAGAFQGLTRAIIRNRLAAEAKELKPQYLAKKITRDPRNDLHVIADFDGGAVEKLGLSLDANGITVFVFNGAGKLIAVWNDVPPGNSLPKALAEAE
ncbi:MAG: hypothetical protein ABIR71_07120 [Chthoniobacterales bacterium]